MTSDSSPAAVLQFPAVGSHRNIAAVSVESASDPHPLFSPGEYRSRENSGFASKIPGLDLHIQGSIAAAKCKPGIVSIFLTEPRSHGILACLIEKNDDSVENTENHANWFPMRRSRRISLINALILPGGLPGFEFDYTVCGSCRIYKSVGAAVSSRPIQAAMFYLKAARAILVKPARPLPYLRSESRRSPEDHMRIRDAAY